MSGITTNLSTFPQDVQNAYGKIDSFIKTLGKDIQLKESETMMGYYRHYIGNGHGFVWIKPTGNVIHFYLTQASANVSPYTLPFSFQPIRGKSRIRANGYGGNTEISFHTHEIESQFDIIKDLITLAYKLRK